MSYVIPTEAEVSAALVAEGLPVPSRLAAIVDAVTARWESDTGFDPFLADGASESVFFDPPAGTILCLRGGNYTLTAVHLNYFDSTGAVGGYTALVIGLDVFTMPSIRHGGPITHIKFRSIPEGDPGSIEVIGIRGWAPTIPADAYMGLLRGMMAESIVPGVLGAIGYQAGVKQGAKEVSTSLTSTGNKAVIYAEYYRKQMIGYRRIDIT